MKVRDIAITVGVGYGIYWLYSNRQKFNIFSDQNVAYTTADKVAKLFGGEKATITDIIPGTNTYNANAAATAKPSAMPSTAAPYWYNADGSKRTAPAGLMGTAYDFNGALIQIIDKATQRAVMVG